MIEFTHSIASAMGLHARPVAYIARCVLDHQSAVTVTCCNQTVDGQDMVGLMGLDARCNDELAIAVSGPDEEDTARELKKICQQTL